MDFETRRKLDAYKRSAAAQADGMIKTGDAAECPAEEPANGAAGRQAGWRSAAEAFTKIPYRQTSPEADEAAGKQESKARKVAKFLILIGPDQAARVLANLDENQVENISREIAGIRGITKEEASDIFAEFQGLLSSSLSYGGAVGGPDEARRLLYAAFGPEKGEAFLRRSVPDIAETSFSFLEDFSGEQVAVLLRDELPATGAVILSRISPGLAAKTLTCAAPEWRLEVARRIGRLGKISPEALEKTASALREKARNISGVVTSDVDGMGALAAILKHSAVSFGDRILNELSNEDPDLGGKLKERLYTLDDVIRAENMPIQKKLREMDVHDIAVLVKGRGEAFTEKILSNISARRRAEVQDELSFMGLISKKDADAAIKSFMEWFRNERNSGQILMLGDELVS